MNAEPGILYFLEKLLITFSAFIGSLFQAGHVDADLQQQTDALWANLPEVRLELRVEPEDAAQSEGDVAIIVQRFEQLGYTLTATPQDDGSWVLSMEGPKLDRALLQRLLQPGRLVIGKVVANDSWHNDVPTQMPGALGVEWRRIGRQKMVPAVPVEGVDSALTELEADEMEDVYSSFSSAFVAPQKESLEPLLPLLKTEGLQPFTICVSNTELEDFCLLQMVDTDDALTNGDFIGMVLLAAEYGMYYEITLTDAASVRFEKMTRESTGLELPIIFDSHALVMPRVMEPITGNKLWITGNHSINLSEDEQLIEARIFATLVTGKALFTTWQITSEKTID
ncbi:MAG: hypothetical protein JXR91_08305 [Deltaproteobacteria bacterium]|nr:hypothetical protein [Deltaproteobacteria bacterium]